MNIELTGRIEEDWSEGIKIWEQLGRVEDLPRDVRVPKYAPSLGKRYGQEFAKAYKSNFEAIVSKLEKGNELEKLCAFEVLELICWEYGQGNVPSELLNIEFPIPQVILCEIPGSSEVESFNGTTIKEWFRAVFST